MANDISLVFCGNRIADLHGMRLMAKIYAEHREIITEIMKREDLSLPFPKVGPAVALLRWIGQLRQQMQHQEASSVITYPELRSPVLSLAQSANATHQYDKIFGMLALLPKHISAAMESFLAELPTAAKHMSMQQSCNGQEQVEAAFVKKLFIAFAKSVVQATNDLDIIFARNTFQNSRSTLDLPSWVTDWTLNPDRSLHIPSHEWYFANEEGIYDQFIDEKQDNLPLTSEEWVPSLEGRRADGGRPRNFCFSKDGTLLSCQAVSIGVVDGIAPEWGCESDDKEAEKWPDTIVQPRHNQSPYDGEDVTAAALLRTMFFYPLDDEKQKAQVFQIP